MVNQPIKVGSKKRSSLLLSALSISIGLSVAMSICSLGLSSAALADASQNKIAVSNSDILSSCYLDGLSEQMQCGSLELAENPAKPDGKQIAVHYAVLPAIKPSFKKQAMLAIAGGPGQSAIENAAGFDRMLAKVRQDRDILLIDQRGTGQSNLLACDDDNMSMLSFNDDDIDITKDTQECLDNLDADVSQYGSLTALTDFEAVRQHLGYEKLHLYGVSYGTRMAQLYMREYPQAIATVTLDGVVPMQQSVIAIGSAIDRGYDLLFKDCQQNAQCQQQFPELKQEFETVDSALAKAPIITQTRDPQTDEIASFTLTRGKYNGAIRMALYMPNIRALIPHAIHQAALGNYQPILGIYTLTADSTGIAMGMHASVVCGEDIHRITDDIRQQAQNSYMSRTMLEGLEATCNVWAIPAVDDSFSDAIESDIPTLLLSGELDPATPPSWGDMATEKLTNAKHFTSQYATHGVAYQSCGNELIADLVKSGSIDDIDAECLEQDTRRSFYLNANTVETIPAGEE
ncbi:alpha/beta hydrolase [Shewanella sp. 4_MG-2023]|uniref:alpha/beta hydrolase n=1 Tax=Shewanella sp. 4_MG-2023 TaxID=3062652 RepID=UPI0026E2669D|nr:alpha/beta hydrolase [Shewanella sp. 4_MG-2023]MDO6678778.1 alpha/beta hydrolase [Shewanella sp. 4_MG-2023]